MKRIKRIIEYFKDVKCWMSHYEKHWYKKKNRKIYLRNALYCVAPARWRLYNKMLNTIFKT